MPESKAEKEAREKKDKADKEASEAKAKADKEAEDNKSQKQTLKEGRAAFAKALESANKMRRTSKLYAIGTALGAFASVHGIKEANELHKKHNLAGEGIHRVSEPPKK